MILCGAEFCLLFFVVFCCDIYMPSLSCYASSLLSVIALVAVIAMVAVRAMVAV